VFGTYIYFSFFILSCMFYLRDLITVQPFRSSSLVNLFQPSVHSSLKITDRFFRYAAPHLWNKLAPTLCVSCQSGASSSPSQNFPFLKVFPSTAFYPWNLTTLCLAVTGGGVLVSAADWTSPAGFWAHYNIVILTNLLTYSLTKRRYRLIYRSSPYVIEVLSFWYWLIS